MSYLGRYEGAIAKRPWPFIAVILVITIAMIFFSTRVSFSAGEDSFSPSTEEGEANTRVREQYGTQANPVTVLFMSDDNVLSRENLDAMLVLEGMVLDSEAAEHLVATSTDPDGIGSPAEIVVVSRILGALGAEFASAVGAVPGGPGGDGDTDGTDTSGGASGTCEQGPHYVMRARDCPEGPRVDRRWRRHRTS